MKNIGENMEVDKFGRELYDAVCSKCGAPCKVPFKPTEGKPVYCKDCYKPKRNYGGFGNSFGNNRRY